MTVLSFDLTEGTRAARAFAPPGSLTTGRVDVRLELPDAEPVERALLNTTLRAGELLVIVGVGAVRFVGEPLRLESLSRVHRLGARDGSGRRAEARELGPDRHLVVGWNHLGRREVAGYAGFPDVPVYVVVTAYGEEAALGAAVALVTQALQTVTVAWGGPA